jgi:hypothetical protein
MPFAEIEGREDAASRGEQARYVPLSEVETREAQALVADPDEQFPELARRLRGGDPHLARQLEALARGDLPGFDEAARSLALEVLSAARTVGLQPTVLSAILAAFSEPSEVLRFGAVAAAANLSRPARREIIPRVRFLAERDLDPDVRAAAEAFLRRNA